MGLQLGVCGDDVVAEGFSTRRREFRDTEDVGGDVGDPAAAPSERGDSKDRPIVHWSRPPRTYV